MICPKCGTQNDDENQKCTNCGTPLPLIKLSSDKGNGLNSIRNIRLLFLFPLLFAGIIVTAIGFICFQPKIFNRTSNQPTSSIQTNSGICIRTTSSNQEVAGKNSTQFDTGHNIPGSTSAIIQSLTEDTGGCLKFVGDIIHFSMNVGETGGVATVDIGGVHKGIQLNDDGTHGDKVANDGIYEHSYETNSTDVIRSGVISGHFTSKNGKVTIAINTPNLITITDWKASGGSIDPNVNYIPHPVTGNMYDPNRVIILFEEGVSTEEILSITSDHNLILSSWIPQIYAIEVALSTNQNYEEIRNKLLEYTSIEAVGQNYATEKLSPPSQILDERLPIDQANYINIIRAKLGWSISKGKSIIDVTTIESGIYQKHIDLIGQIYNYSPDKDIEDLNGHGTFIAGIIVAKEGNSGIRGIAPDIRLSFYKREENVRKTVKSHTLIGLCRTVWDRERC